jgi:hypothetical protein
MSSVLSHEVFDPSVGHAFGEMFVLEQISQLPDESVLRILQTIPDPLLQRAVEVRQPPPAAQGKGRKVLRGAKIIAGGQLVMEVQVREIFAGGCRIWTRAPSSVPERFTIRIIGFPGEQHCKVHWRAGEELGLQFTAD